MRTLYVTDLDGTLLKPDRTIGKRSVAILNQLLERGLLFTFATARSIHSAYALTKELRISLPVITTNGVELTDFRTQTKQSAALLTAEAIGKIREAMQECAVFPYIDAYIQGRERIVWLEGRETPGLLTYLKEHEGDPRLYPVHSVEELFAGEVFYVTFIGDEAALQPFYRKMKGDESCNVLLQRDVYHPNYWCEVFSREATKANAMLRLKEMYGCDRVVVFGDGINDISMFEAADECYAVANADEELKRIATGVIDSNGEDGVALWLREHAVFETEPQKGGACEEERELP